MAEKGEKRRTSEEALEWARRVLWKRYEKASLKNLNRHESLFEAFVEGLALMLMKVQAGDPSGTIIASYQDRLRRYVQLEEKSLGLPKAELSEIDRDKILLGAIARLMADIMSDKRIKPQDTPDWW